MLVNLDRRALLAGGAATLLSGCATSGRRLKGECTPLTPVKLDAAQITRAYGCLRPYRAAGFVVRRDRFSDKALVHNYGHGGAGITLSWGTSRLATSLGLAGHSGPVAVIGAGVMGLTTARLVQEAGFPVTIYTAEVPMNTTSNLAGGQWGPTGHYRESAVTAEWRSQYKAALAASWERFRAMDEQRYGIRWLPTYTEADRLAAPGLAPYFPGSRLLAQSDHPFSVRDLAVYRTMYVEVGRYLAELAADFLRAGGSIRMRRFTTPAELSELAEPLLFNCTGLGARELFGDQELGPVRGQIVMLAPQPEVQYAYTLPSGYMFPRGDGIVLGGTFERNMWSTVPDPQTVSGIVEAHRRLMAGLRCTA
ncbi:FAD-dependent oxidoreductase [Sphingomonas sp.]|uniref:FAD-dependent oxidoreductase n=1 Tax=Sphingomonas sp. TaxID=28214 RepID=UPI00184C749A|nr:FAD-dependent oxidoreductase [Sphingomonas sp.]MBA3511072.1 FAD-dependent oxidoreductase [Sphingomonas sp.]